MPKAIVAALGRTPRRSLQEQNQAKIQGPTQKQKDEDGWIGPVTTPQTKEGKDFKNGSQSTSMPDQIKPHPEIILQKCSNTETKHWKQLIGFHLLQSAYRN